VTTIIPYSDPRGVAQIAARGGGSLVGSIVSYDTDFVRDVVLGAAPHHGRLLVLDRDCAGESTGHGSAIPQMVHGGPGRAGGGEELGGMRAVRHYMQRTGLQGSPAVIAALTGDS
jgi:oxepin-CoA hydrolase/3-oxo-5,6-dehydrosuberyl-CoA semialdehyde dehydrogenase